MFRTFSTAVFVPAPLAYTERGGELRDRALTALQSDDGGEATEPRPNLSIGVDLDNTLRGILVRERNFSGTKPAQDKYYTLRGDFGAGTEFFRNETRTGQILYATGDFGAGTEFFKGRDGTKPARDKYL